MKVSHLIYIGVTMATYAAMQERASQVASSLLSQAHVQLNNVEKCYVSLTRRISDAFKSSLKCAKKTIESKTGNLKNIKYDGIKKSLESLVEKGKSLVQQSGNKSVAIEKIVKPGQFARSNIRVSEENEKEKQKKVNVL